MWGCGRYTSQAEGLVILPAHSGNTFVKLKRCSREPKRIVAQLPMRPPVHRKAKMPVNSDLKLGSRSNHQCEQAKRRRSVRCESAQRAGPVASDLSAVRLCGLSDLANSDHSMSPNCSVTLNRIFSEAAGLANIPF